ncbi:MAG: enolase C-terminal domain-like protein [Chloroflexota bacterium]
MKITDISLFRVHGTWQGSGFPPGDRQAQQPDIYPEFNQSAGMNLPNVGLDDPQPISAIYVEIETDEGVSGIFGPIQHEQAYLIKTMLRPYLIGRDPLATEQLYDQMIRMNRHGRSGMYMTAVSPVDCALWDLKGKAWNQPIYRLLGGPTQLHDAGGKDACPAVPAYISLLGYSVEPTRAATVARQYKAQGFTAQKWFFRYGPGDGEAGKAKNLAMAKAVRDAVGSDYRLMFDAFMGWDVTYAIEMVRALEPIRPFWMEEPIPPERISSFHKIRQAANVPIATGEHIYTRWQTKELLVNNAVDFLQNDPDWTGGITELVKVCALGSSFDVPVIAHGHSLLAALHVATAQSPATVPYVEFLVRHQPGKQYFHKPFIQPKEGIVYTPDLPGLGLVLDEDKVERREAF